MGSQTGSDLDEALATCNRLPSELDNWVLSLNTSVMEDNVENDVENVTNNHEERFKGSTPNMPHTNFQLQGVPKKMVILSGFEFLTLGGVFIGVKK